MSYRGAVWIVATAMCLAVWYCAYLAVKDLTLEQWLDFIYGLFLLAVVGAAAWALMILRFYR